MTATDPPPDEATDGRPFDGRFVTVVAAALAYFLGLGILAPVLPRYIEDVLDGGGLQVGIAVGAFAVTAALLRPWAGSLGDRRGRRILLVGGAAGRRRRHPRATACPAAWASSSCSGWWPARGRRRRSSGRPPPPRTWPRPAAGARPPACSPSRSTAACPSAR